jgi:hypothetical protein
MRTPVVTLPAELERSAPRDVGLTAGGRTLAVLAWVLWVGAVAAGAALYLEARRQSISASDFDRRSMTATAVVDRVWRKSGDGNPTYAAFHFDAGDARIDGESRMQRSVWKELRAGSTLRVRYLPENPRAFLLDGQRRNRLPSGVSLVVSSVLAALALLCGVAVRKQRALLSEGRAACAVVTALKKHKGTHGESHVQMTYEFPSRAGRTVIGKAATGKDTQVGTSIVVVYDPENPARSRPYPFSLVRLDRES